MASNSKNIAELLNGDTTLTATDIANDAVTADKIATGAVVADGLGAGAVTATKLGAGSVTNAKLGADAITTAKIADTVNLGRRNIIINGAMQISQRATTKTSAGTGYWTVDRWNQNMGGLGAFTQSQNTDAPYGFMKSLKFDCTTADASPSANDALWIEQRIEGQNLQQLGKGTSSAKQMTVSFWVKSSKTGVHVVGVFDNDNTRSISKSYTVSVADTWEYKTITYPADTTGTFGKDNNMSLLLQWWLGAGSTFTGGSLADSWAAYSATGRATGQVNLADSTSNNWHITGVQVEVGDTATPFEHLTYAEDLLACQRYYQVDDNAYGNSGKSYSMAGLDMPVTITRTHPVTMRASPTVVFTSNNRDSSNNVVGANLNSSVADSWWYGYRKTGGSSLEVGIQVSGLSFSAEL